MKQNKSLMFVLQDSEYAVDWALRHMYKEGKQGSSVMRDLSFAYICLVALC